MNAKEFMAANEKDRRGPKDGGPIGLGAARILGIDMSGVPRNIMRCKGCDEKLVGFDVNGYCQDCLCEECGTPLTSEEEQGMLLCADCYDDYIAAIDRSKGDESEGAG